MKSDFNGDGNADVLWQNSSGARAAREASVAGTHATRLDRVSPYRGFRKLLPAGRG